MEGGKIGGPPRVLERAVVSLIPPAARESVAGDLWEIYRGPWAYLADALPVLFCVVLSQIRRGANPPLLILQGLLLFLLFTSLVPIGDALGLTIMVVSLGLLIGAYQSGGRPSPRRAMIEAVLLAGGAAELSGLMAAHLVHPDWTEAPYFTFLGPYLVPLLCLMRTGILRWSDRAMAAAPREALSLAALRQLYAQTQRSVGRRNGVEVVLLVVAAMALPEFGFIRPIYLSAALYLLLMGGAAPCSAGMGFVELRALYQRQLSRQHAMRCFLWWAWFTPLVLCLRGAFSAKSGHLLQLSTVAAVLVMGYFIESLNRERHGVQEEIGRLSLVVEVAG